MTKIQNLKQGGLLCVFFLETGWFPLLTIGICLDLDIWNLEIPAFKAG
jgi:hypothetical protein